jgi:hypothetical protein
MAVMACMLEQMPMLSAMTTPYDLQSTFLYNEPAEEPEEEQEEQQEEEEEGEEVVFSGLQGI